MEELVTGQIDTLAFGGYGVLRHNNFVIFVPFTAPGDRITCRIVDKKKRYAFGVVEEYLQKGPSHTTPGCPYYGECGGCQLQHLTYEAQLDYKQTSVKDAFSRIGSLGDVPLEILPAEMQWQYRRHVTLHFKQVDKICKLGYIAIDHKSLLSITHCPIFNNADDPVISEARELANFLDEGDVSIYKQDDKYVLHYQLDKMPSESYFQKALARNSSWLGIVVSNGRKVKSFGQTTLHIVVEGLNISFTPHTFIQNHPEQSLNIYKKVMEIAEATKASHVLDFYCGIGISSLLLAQKKHSSHGD